MAGEIEHIRGKGFDANPENRCKTGKPKGTKNRSTIIKEALSLSFAIPDKDFKKLKAKYPDIDQSMTVAEIMTITQTAKAIDKADTAAYKAVMDYAPEELMDEDEAEKAAKYFKIRDGIIDKHYRFLDEGHDWSIEEGGSRSGKTYNALKWCVTQTLKGRFDLNLIAPSYKMLSNGMFLDVKAIIEEFQLDVKVPKQTTRIEMPNGSQWVFEVVTDENEAKRNRGNVIVDEADGIPKEVGMLLGRAKGRKIVLFNPVKRFWAHDNISDDESNLLRTTWKDNRFIAPAQLKWLEDLKKRGEFAEEGSPERYAYEVYYLGNYSLLSGKAYELSDFNIVDEVPEKFDYMMSYSDPSLGTGNDFFAGLLFGIKKSQVWVVDCIFSQFTKADGYIEQLKKWDEQYSHMIDHYAESNGVSGVVTGAVDVKYDGVLSPVNNTSKKEADIIVYASTAKRFKFLRSQKMIDFLNQCAEFPNAPHDDAPDCLGRGAKLLIKHFDI